MEIDENPFADWDRYVAAEFKRKHGDGYAYAQLAYDDHYPEGMMCEEPDPECGHKCTRPLGHKGMCEVAGMRTRGDDFSRMHKPRGRGYCHARWDPVIVVMEAI